MHGYISYIIIYVINIYACLCMFIRGQVNKFLEKHSKTYFF